MLLLSEANTKTPAQGSGREVPEPPTAASSRLSGAVGYEYEYEGGADANGDYTLFGAGTVPATALPATAPPGRAAAAVVQCALGSEHQPAAAVREVVVINHGYAVGPGIDNDPQQPRAGLPPAVPGASVAETAIDGAPVHLPRGLMLMPVLAAPSPALGGYLDIGDDDPGDESGDTDAFGHGASFALHAPSNRCHVRSAVSTTAGTALGADIDAGADLAWLPPAQEATDAEASAITAVGGGVAAAGGGLTPDGIRGRKASVYEGFGSMDEPAHAED